MNQGLPSLPRGLDIDGGDLLCQCSDGDDVERLDEGFKEDGVGQQGGGPLCIADLDLQPHPEGGYGRELSRTSTQSSLRYTLTHDCPLLQLGVNKETITHRFVAGDGALEYVTFCPITGVLSTTFVGREHTSTLTVPGGMWKGGRLVSASGTPDTDASTHVVVREDCTPPWTPEAYTAVSTGKVRDVVDDPATRAALLPFVKE